MWSLIVLMYVFVFFHSGLIHFYGFITLIVSLLLRKLFSNGKYKILDECVVYLFARYARHCYLIKEL